MSFALWAAVSTAIVCAASAVMIATMLPALGRLASRLAPAVRARLWKCAAAAPLALSVVFSGAVLWPAVVGPDHCTLHEAHHPQLCPVHSSGLPSPMTMVLTALVALRVGSALVLALRRLLCAARTGHELSAVARPAGKDIHVLPVEAPIGFVLGLFRPRLFVSSGLLSCGSAVDVRVVLEHERAHARAFHPLRSALSSMLLAFHLPFASAWLRRRLELAYESAADAEAARAVRDPLRVADAIVRAARAPRAFAASAFNGGDIAIRVDDLIHPRTLGADWSSSIALALVSLGCFAVAVGGAGEIHHGLETLLGWLQH